MGNNLRTKERVFKKLKIIDGKVVGYDYFFEKAYFDKYTLKFISSNIKSITEQEYLQFVDNK